ncbi:hypothetical protein BDA96_06G103500 [Sorghum bicolor]|uniref:rRNA N-glycosidase n=1 Tax=Sorghum bicolor TaxID=4558 RepID=A0A921QQ54_SORBI|nr:hypothetical protein BDA96_06G103500 [Sorghum bicolor]
MLGKNSKDLDEFNCLLRDLSTKLEDLEQKIISGRQEMLQIKQEKEEMDRSYKERLYSNDTTIKEKDSVIKQLEGSVDENKSRLTCLDSCLQCMEQELKLKDDVCISLKGNLASSESEKNSLELMNKGHILEIEKLCQDNKNLKELLSSFMVKVTELDKEHASVSSHVSRLISSFERFYEMAQDEKMLMARPYKDKFEHLQSQYVDLMSENNALKTEIEELKSRLVELQRTQEIVMVQHVEERQVAEDKIRRIESEAEVSASNINQLEKLASELQGRIQKLLEDSTLAENHKQELLQKILKLESDNLELRGQVQSIMEEKSNNAETLQGEITKRDQQVNTLENQINQLCSVLDEKEQLYLCYVETEKTLEDQKLQVEASLSATECQLSDAKKQYDLMLEGEKIELSKHLKELSLKNDQAINEIRKKYELVKIEITNAEKEKAEKLIREIENKCNENISQNKHDYERYLICLKKEHGTMVARIQQDNEHKQSTLWAYLKEELQRIQSQAENELKEKLSLLRKEHEFQIKSLRIHHEEKCQRMQEELELQKSKEEKQRARVDQEVNSKKEELLQKISKLESNNQEHLGQVHFIMEEKSNNAESLQGEITKRDQQVNTLENKINQLHSVLDEKEQLYLCSVEREKTLEDQKLQVEASLSATECQLSKAQKQYDLMPEGEKIELSKHLQELSLKNDQAINEIRKKYEHEKIEITNAEKEKAEKLIGEIGNKCNESISEKKHDSEKYSICLKEQHGSTIIVRQIHFSPYMQRRKDLIEDNRKDLMGECHPGNTATIVLDPNDLDRSTRSYKRAIRKARKWCRSNRKPVDISKHFGPGAEVFTTPGKGTFHFIYKYDDRSLTVSLSERNLYIKGWHGDRFGGFKIDKQFIEDQNYRFIDTGDNYTALCRDRDVSTVRIGFEPVIENFEVLHKCNGVISTNVLRAIAVFAVHGPEAIRLEDVFQAILDSYDNKQSILGKKLSLLVKNYGFYSAQLLYCVDTILGGGEEPQIVNKKGIEIKSVQELRNKIRVPLWSSYLMGKFEPNGLENTSGWCPPYSDNNWVSSDETDNEMSEIDDDTSLSEENEETETDDDMSLSEEKDSRDSRVKLSLFSEMNSSISRFGKAIDWDPRHQIRKNGLFDFGQCRSQVFGRTVDIDCMDQFENELGSSSQYRTWRMRIFGKMAGWRPRRLLSSTWTLMGIRKLL